MIFIDCLKWIYRKPQQYVIRLNSLIRGSKFEIDKFHNRNVVIISPHPDDEVFGCGGLISTLRKQGSNVEIIFLSKGEGIIKIYSRKDEFIKARANLSQKALDFLGVSSDHIHYLDFKDGKFRETNPKEFDKLKNLILKLNPDVLFYPHHWDGSPDHEFASNCIKNITSNLDFPKYEYCVWLWHHTKLWKTFILDYKNCLRHKVDLNVKKKASNIYTTAKDKEGIYYSGKLPELFLEAVNWKYELYFKV